MYKTISVKSMGFIKIHMLSRTLKVEVGEGWRGDYEGTPYSPIC